MARFQILFESTQPGKARTSPRTRVQPATSPASEWSARPPGRLGRPLVEEVERYLEFYAIARS